jgi:hypothetical protein
MGKLYNFVMVRCTTLLEKFFKCVIDLDIHLLRVGNGGLPMAPVSNFWQSRRPRTVAGARPVSNMGSTRSRGPLIGPVVEHAQFNGDQLSSALSSRTENGPVQQRGDDGVGYSLTMAWLTPVSGRPNSPAE